MPQAIDWSRVARFLDTAADKRQADANTQAIAGSKTAARIQDESAFLLRTIAAALRFGEMS